MSSQILLYSGPGAGPYCTQALRDQILNLYDDRSCRLNEVASISDCWNDPCSVKVVLVPGGNMREMSKHNEIPRNRSRIKEIFDKHCIAYYGACAGGLLACNDFQMQASKTSNFIERKIELYKVENISLNLAPIHAIAPLDIFPSSGILSTEDFHISNMVIGSERLPSAHILSAGYVDVQKVGAKILAKRETILPICEEKETHAFPRKFTLDDIAETLHYEEFLDTYTFESRHVILTSFHPEVSSSSVLTEKFKVAFNATNKQQQELATRLEPTDSRRSEWLRKNFIKIGIPCK